MHLSLVSKGASTGTQDPRGIEVVAAARNRCRSGVTVIDFEDKESRIQD
jgi:hypothetical protein